MSEEKQPVSDQLIRTTARIVCKGADGSESKGTSFLFLACPSPGQSIPLLITNRHVVDGYETAEVSISVVPSGRPDTEPTVLPVDFQKLQSFIVYHPDKEVDLAAIFLGPGLRVLSKHQLDLANLYLHEANIATDEILSDCCAIEDLVMIGYPNGIWDSKNNRPIVRRAISATPIWERYEGEQKFLIDCACFPGSSGSPVFLFREGTVTRRSGLTLGGRRVALAGVLHAGFVHLAHGRVVQTPIATLQNYQASLRIPNSIGICLNSSQVKTLVDHVVAFAGSQLSAA